MARSSGYDLSSDIARYVNVNRATERFIQRELQTSRDQGQLTADQFT